MVYFLSNQRRATRRVFPPTYRCGRFSAVFRSVFVLSNDNFYTACLCPRYGRTPTTLRVVPKTQNIGIVVDIHTIRDNVLNESFWKIRHLKYHASVGRRSNNIRQKRNDHYYYYSRICSRIRAAAENDCACDIFRGNSVVERNYLYSPVRRSFHTSTVSHVSRCTRRATYDPHVA